MTDQSTIKLRIPRQDIEQCSFFAIEETAVDEWVSHLPTTNLGQTTQQLFKLITELNRVRMLPEKRLMVLERLRPTVSFVSRSLSKHYLKQNIVLPKQAQKVATLAYRLHQQQAIGYTIAATHSAAISKPSGMSDSASLIGTALHRAITDHTINIKRHFQLYEPVATDTWHNLHQFYLFAQQYHVLDQAIDDGDRGSCTFRECYIRALLLGAAKPNQLRQKDFTGILTLLTAWAKHCHIESAEQESLFVFDPQGDSCPVYGNLFDTTIPTHWLSLNTKALIDHLSAAKDSAEKDNTLPKEGEHTVSKDLLNHLILSWNSASKRLFMRLDTEDSLDLAVGLSATHHYISGEEAFTRLIEEPGIKTYTTQDNPFMKVESQVARNKDIWDSPYEQNFGNTSASLENVDFHHHKSGSTDNDSSLEKQYQHYSVKLVNSSAHGYCLKWPADIEARIKTGEIVGIKEAQSKNWSIGIIRWVNLDPQSTQLGLELISPNASPYGARIIHKTGDQGDYMRALVLPEMSVLNRPMTLLTPRVPFRTGQKVILNQHGRQAQVLLQKKLNGIGNYNLFEFRKLSGMHAKSSDSLSDSGDDFDSLWENL